jgi:uncharacterized protein (TIGR03000 family)
LGDYSSYYSGPTTYSDANASGSAVASESSDDDSGAQINNNAALVAVRLPADAELWFNGVKMPQTGQVRRFQTPPLQPGKEYSYEVRCSWRQDAREVNQTRRVMVHANDLLGLNFLPAQGGGPVAPR